MGLSVTQVTEVLSEFPSEFIGGMIKKIDQPTPITILFEIEHHRQRRRLLFSAHPRFSRFHIVHQKPSNPKVPPNFCQLLRAHLRYKKIAAIKQIKDDRIIQVAVTWSNHDQIRMTFVAELTGPASNLFLLNEKGNIIGWLSTPHQSRQLAQGSPYSPPPGIQSSQFKETLIPRFSAEQYPFNASLEIYYAALEKAENEEQTKKEILARFENNIRQVKKRRDRLTARFIEAKKSVKYQQYGEFLKCHLHEIKTGADHFLYLDPSLDAQKAVPSIQPVALDPALSPVENMVRFFNRYKKGMKAIANMNPILQETKRALLQLENGKQDFLEKQIFDPADFPLKRIGQKQAAQKGAKGPPSYLSSDKFRIIVGRSDLENEKVTFGLARGNDLWLHARGAPGAHVLIQMAGHKEVPHHTLLEAANLALHFSPCKKSGKGEVMYTFKKYLQRPKKGKTGSVICSQEKTLYLEIEPKRLDQILQNRIDVIRQ